MEYYSTNNPMNSVSLREAVLKGLAPDQGLYMPKKIPKLQERFFKNSKDLDLKQVGYEVISSLFSTDLSENQIIDLVNHTLSFEIPLVALGDNIFSLELFHGPTLAFKDIGARFCSKLMSYLIYDSPQKIRVLVATSGDTGSAVANGFLGDPKIEVVILYPKDKVSSVQEMQFTTLSKNIIALEVDGTFDDCQRLVKQAFLDEEINRQFILTSANSINIARWIPQTLYYFYSWSRLDSNKKVSYAVPSGNFGNLAAGILAQKMGLPIDTFIAATNINRIVPDYLEGKGFNPTSSFATISNSMDVGNPSNFPRLIDLFKGDEKRLKDSIIGYVCNDDETASTMSEVYSRCGYILDPHGAVAYAALSNHLSKTSGVTGVFLETAHPAKFKKEVDRVLGIQLELPDKLQEFMQGTKCITKISNKFEDLKDFIQA